MSTTPAAGPPDPEDDAVSTPGGSPASGPAAGDAAPPDLSDVHVILAEVAAGRIPPDRAAVLLDQARSRAGEDAGRAAGRTGAAGDTRGPAAPVLATPTRLRVRAVGRRVRILGEPFISTVAVDGPHVVSQEGDTVLVTSEGELSASLDGFTLLRTRSLRDVQERVLGLGRELQIRVNPQLAVDVEITAGSVSVERLPRLDQVRITAGQGRIRDLEGPVDVLVQAGSARIEGRFVRGRSRLRAESGSLQIAVLHGSSVRVRSDVQLGRVSWEPPRHSDTEERVIGTGTARLDIEGVMASVSVREES